MPHCLLEYSANLEEHGDFPALTKKIAATMLAQRHQVQGETVPVFPIGGVRVRAYRTESYCIGDGSLDAGFVHAEMKIGAGRSAETIKQSGDAVFATIKEHFAQEFARSGLALSMEINEFSEEGSWKHNNLHQKYKARSQA
jgi:5-carboxymethyl-2-hydroxymuconate isomerase